MNGEHDEPDDDEGTGGAYVAAYLLISAGIVVAALCAGLFAVFSK